MEDIVIVESKDYAQVVFDDVKECYIENKPLECWFNLNELLKANSSDTIGIYKVGFVNFKDYFCSQAINADSIENCKGKVLFKAESIPKDDGEFYQFVYVSQSKQIRGASVPFQFKKTHISDYIEVEDNEAILIKSKETAINETITEIKSRCVHLTQANDKYEKLVQENEELIKTLQDEVTSFKLRCLKLNMDNEKITYALKLKSENVNNLTNQLTSLNDENNKLQMKFDDLRNENKNLLDSLEYRIDQINQLKNDLENVKMSKGELETILSIKECELSRLRKDKDELNRIACDLTNINDQITKLEEQVNEKVDELNKIKLELKKNETIVSEQTVTIQNILGERDALNNMIQKLTHEKIQLECSQENLSQELNMSKDKLLAAEQCKEMLRAQMVVLTEELDAANAKIDIHLATIKLHEENGKKYQEEKIELANKIETMKQDYEAKIQEINGSYYALKFAHVHLETRLKSMDQSKLNLEKETEKQKHELDKLKEENQELRERIQAGAKEYSKLFEKYRLIKNQQFNYDMNLYHDLNGADILIRKDMNRFNTTHNIQRQGSFFGTSTPNIINNSESDSAITDKTVSQTQTPSGIARASSAEIENTLLDALLGSSFGWNNNNNNNNNTLTNNKHTIPDMVPKPITTTTQPKMISTIKPTNKHEHNDLSDDGLINLNANSNDENDVHLNSNNLIGACKPPIDFINLRPVEVNNVLNIHSNLRDEDDNVFTENNTENILRNRFNNGTIKRLPSTKTNMLDGLNIKSCDICNYIFPTDVDISDIEKHYSIHYGPSCPVCFLLFRKGYPQKEFEDHVNSHFSN